MHKKENINTHTNVKKNGQHKHRQINTRTQKSERLVTALCHNYCENFENGAQKNKQRTSHPRVN